MTKLHVWEQVAEELAVWIDDMAEQVADGLLGGGRSPFGAELSEEEKLDYYERQVFNPDGTPNVEGRQRLLNRVGVRGFVQIMSALAERRGRGRLPTPPESEPQPGPVGARTIEEQEPLSMRQIGR